MTIQTYYEVPLHQEAEASVLQITTKNGKTQIVLDETLFYPGGGGQLCDQGTITGENGGVLTVTKASLDTGRIIHEGVLTGVIEDHETVRVRLNWERRLEGMKLHSAGHALHEAMLQISPTGLIPQRAEHNHDPFIEYAGLIANTDPKPLEEKLNELIRQSPQISMRKATFDEIKAGCRFVPANLPRNKPLRVVQIGNGELVPCGGVHLPLLGDAGRIEVTGIRHTADQVATKVHYRLSKL